MKRAIILLGVVGISCALYAFRTLEVTTGEFLSTLGITDDRARDCIWSSLSGMYLSYPITQQIRNTPRNQRAALVREIGLYAKKYTQSEEFKQKYLEFRQNNKPSPPEPPKTTEQQRKEQKESMQKAIHDTEEGMKSMTPEMQASMKEVVKMYKEQLKSLDDPNNPMFSKQMAEMLQQSHEQAMKEYQRKLAKWEQDYPSSPTSMVKGWLTKFMDESRDIDFNAKLIDGEYGKKVFAKTEYERKSSNWKMCFRAGRETVEAGRAFAREWLEELDHKQ